MYSQRQACSSCMGHAAWPIISLKCLLCVSTLPAALCLDIRQSPIRLAAFLWLVNSRDLPVAYSIFDLCHLEIRTIRARKQAA